MSDMGDKRLLMKTDRSCQRFSHQGGGENDRTLHKRSELIFPPRLDPGTRRDKSIPSSGIGNSFRKNPAGIRLAGQQLVREGPPRNQLVPTLSDGRWRTGIIEEMDQPSRPAAMQ
jgi:hypothetical protein